MKLIPDPVFSFNSRAEAKVHHLLSSLNLDNDWVALHSVNCSEHAYKQWSEIDFLLVGGGGIFVLEVKGGGVSTENGIWTYENRYGEVARSTEGPFNQAKSARFSLEQLLRKRFQVGFERAPVFGFGVVFPDCPWNTESPEMPRAIVADKSDCATPAQFGNFIRRLRTYWQSKFPESAALTSSDRKKLVQVLRPDVDQYPPFTLRLGQVVEEMQTLTDEQFERLDILEANKQAIIRGGAGTGKTFVLLQAARRAAARGHTVLVVTDSDVLAAYIRKLEPDSRIRIEAYSSLSQLETDPSDVLFIDEGQDLLSLEHLDELGRHLNGGLEDGTWRWFMDDNNQANVRGVFDPEALEMLEQGLGNLTPISVPLRRNVRNTKEIISTVEKWTGARLGITEVTGYGFPPKVISVQSEESALQMLEERLHGLEEADVAFDTIGVVALGISPRKLTEALRPSLRRKCLVLDATTVKAALKNKALVGSASSFKGLERPIIIVVDVALNEIIGNRNALSYVASTRANYDLTVITDTPSTYLVTTQKG